MRHGQAHAVLHSRLDARETTGIDRSEKMLEPARAQPQPHGVQFQTGTIEAFAGNGSGPFDVIFSNAAFHWVADHDA